MDIKCSKELHSKSPAVYVCSETSCWRFLCLKCVTTHEKEFHRPEESRQNLEIITECFESRASLVDEIGKKLEGKWKDELEVQFNDDEEKKMEDIFREISEFFRVRFTALKNEFMEKRYQTNHGAKFFSRIKLLASEMSLLLNKENEKDIASFIDSLKKTDSKLDEIKLLTNSLESNSSSKLQSLAIQINQNALENIKHELDRLFLFNLAGDTPIKKNLEVTLVNLKDRPEEHFSFNIFYEDMLYQFGILTSDNFFKCYHPGTSSPSNIDYILTIASKRVFGPYFLEILGIQKEKAYLPKEDLALNVLYCDGSQKLIPSKASILDLYIVKLKLMNDSKVDEFIAAFTANEFKFILNLDVFSIAGVNNDKALAKSVQDNIIKYLSIMKSDVIQRKAQRLGLIAELSIDSSFIKIENSGLNGSALIFQNSSAFFFDLAEELIPGFKFLDAFCSLQDFEIFTCNSNSKIFIKHENQMAFMSFENQDWLLFHLEAYTAQSWMLTRSDAVNFQEGKFHFRIIESIMRNFILDGSFVEIESAEQVQAKGSLLMLSRTGEMIEFVTPSEKLLDCLLMSLIFKNDLGQLESFFILADFYSLNPVIKSHECYIYSAKRDKWDSFTASSDLFDRWRWNSHLLQKDSLSFSMRFKKVTPNFFVYVRNNLESVVIFKQGGLFNISKAEGKPIFTIENEKLMLSEAVANTQIFLDNQLKNIHIRWIDNRMTTHELLNIEALQHHHDICYAPSTNQGMCQGAGQTNELLSSIELFLSQGQSNSSESVKGLNQRKNPQEQREEKPRKKIFCLNNNKGNQSKPTPKPNPDNLSEAPAKTMKEAENKVIEESKPRVLHEDEVTCIAIYEEKNLMFSGSFDKSLSLYDFEKEEILFNMKNFHQGFIWAMNVFQGYLLTVSNDQSIKISKIEDLLKKEILSKERKIGFVPYCIEIIDCEKENLVVVGGAGGNLVELTLNEEFDLIAENRLQAHEDNITSIKYHRKTNSLLTVGYDRSIKVWKIEGKLELKPIETIHEAHGGFINCLEFLNENHIITTSKDMVVKLWALNPENLKLEAIKHYKSVGEILCMEPLGEGKVLLVSDLQIAILDEENGPIPSEGLKKLFDIKALRKINSKKQIILVDKYCSIFNFEQEKIFS